MKRAAVLALWIIARVAALWAADTVEHPFLGVTHIIRTETAPRSLHIHIVKIDLTAPGIRFKLTPPGGKLETVRQTTLAFLNQEHAQIAINAHFFMPFPAPVRTPRWWDSRRPMATCIRHSKRRRNPTPS